MRVILPKTAAAAAARALRVRKTLPPSRQYGTAVGLSQARKISRGQPIDAKRTYSFLSRAYPAYRDAMRRGLGPETSKAIGAFLLWGGMPAYNSLSRRLA